MTTTTSPTLVCGLCGQPAEAHSDSLDGPMTVCPTTSCEDLCKVECIGACGV